MFGQLPPRGTGSLEDPAVDQTAYWPELPAGPGGAAFSSTWSSETPVSSLSTSQGWRWSGNPSLWLSPYSLLCRSPLDRLVEKVGTLVSFPVFRPRAAGREAGRRARMFLASVLLEFEFFSGICQIQHFLSGSYYTETFLTGCIETLNSFSLKKKKKLGSWKLVIFCICVSTIILFTEVRAEN